jgi:hypothetical protein
MAAIVIVPWGRSPWAGSEAVLPAYLIGMVLAGTVGRDHALIRRLRTLTFGLLIFHPCGLVRLNTRAFRRAFRLCPFS